MTATLTKPDSREGPAGRYADGVTAAEIRPVGDAEAAFARGDDDALRKAYDEHGRLIYTFCSRSLGPERAHDVTQEVFLSAWKRSMRKPEFSSQRLILLSSKPNQRDPYFLRAVSSSCASASTMTNRPPG